MLLWLLLQLLFVHLAAFVVPVVAVPEAGMDKVDVVVIVGVVRGSFLGRPGTQGHPKSSPGDPREHPK